MNDNGSEAQGGDNAGLLRDLKLNLAVAGEDGDADSCRQIAERRLALALQTRDKVLVLDARADLAHALMMRHRARARVLLLACERTARRLVGDGAGQVAPILRTAWKKILLGLAIVECSSDPARALALAKEVREHCEATGDGKHLQEALATEAMALLELSDRHGTSSDKDEAIALFRRADEITIDSAAICRDFCPELPPAAIERRFRVNKSIICVNLSEEVPDHAEEWLRRALAAVDGHHEGRATTVRIRLADLLRTRMQLAEAATLSAVAEAAAWQAGTPAEVFAAASILANVAEAPADRDAASDRAATARRLTGFRPRSTSAPQFAEGQAP